MGENESRDIGARKAGRNVDDTGIQRGENSLVVGVTRSDREKRNRYTVQEPGCAV